eukprot:TRINITY_DN1403_c0_g1_i16.p1 TRINITY_DN1403_c0_g1~~TRINITY_DN1403_c0_g1_i16.p1  ORF type:complete len:139 (-),score=32.34 TRINITY_DN1403_c0_g1_i16:178-594(-)
MTHSWIFVLSLSVLYTLFLYFYIAALPLTAYSLFFLYFFFFLMIRRPPRSTHCISSAASDVYKRQELNMAEKNQKDIQRTPFEPDSEIYRVSTKSQFRQLKYHAQQYLKKYANFELHAIKQASINATQLAQYLSLIHI